MTSLTQIFPAVILGADVRVDEFVVLGRPPKGAQPGEHPLTIGKDSVLRSHSVIYAGTTLGDRFQCGHHVLIREFTVAGSDCSVGTGSVIEFRVTMGDRVRIHSRAFVPELSILEDDAWIGPAVVLTNARYPTSKRAKETLQGVRIQRGARVGANATILPGVTIGERSLVGAGSVVSHDVPPFTIVHGNPARAVGSTKDLRYDDTRELAYPEG